MSPHALTFGLQVLLLLSILAVIFAAREMRRANREHIRRLLRDYRAATGNWRDHRSNLS